jgi:hypothetical protein
MEDRAPRWFRRFTLARRAQVKGHARVDHLGGELLIALAGGD